MEELVGPSLTLNQVVAYNLRAARVLRSLTQEEAAEKLEPYLGVRWSKAQFSAAERSVERERIKHFTADEIGAFSMAFDLPVTWFFLPPVKDEADRFTSFALTKSPDSKPWGYGALLDIVFGKPQHVDLLEQRLAQLEGGQPSVLRSSYQKLVAELAWLTARATIDDVMKDVTRSASCLEHTAELLRTSEKKARKSLEAALLERLNSGISPPPMEEAE